MKKLLSAVLSFVLIVSLFSVIPFTVSADALPHYGELDKYTDYEFDSGTGTLYIWGDDSHPMPDYNNTGDSISPFKNHTEIKKVIVNWPTKIGNYAFIGCTGITSLEINYNYVTAIGSAAFFGCTSLSSIKFDEALTTIESEAFYGCTALTEVNLPAAVNYIGSYAFTNCTNLQYVDIPNPKCSVGDYAFKNCTALKGITLPSDGTAPYGGFNQEVFLNCTSLTTVSFGPGKAGTVIGYNAFSGCTALTDIYFAGTQADWNGIYWYPGNDPAKNATINRNQWWGRCGENMEYVYDLVSKTLTIRGKGVTEDYHESSGKEAPWYRYKDEITNIVIEEGVTVIRMYNFVEQTNLKTVTFPKSLTDISVQSFKDSNAITDINYAGSEAEWANVSIPSAGNGSLSTATVHYGTAPEPTFTVTYNFNGGTKDGEGSYVAQEYACAPDITVENFIDGMGVTPPEGKQLEAIEINGARYELGSSYLLNNDTTYRYIWKNTHTHSYTLKKKDAKYHWDECSCGKIANMSSHSFATVITKATLEKDGAIESTCSCGLTKSKTIVSRPKTISLSATSYTYNGKEKKPTVTVKGADDKVINAGNYTVSYAGGRKNAGSYAVTVTFGGNYEGTKKLTFSIQAKSITKCTVTGVKDKTYTGKELKQSITAKDGTTALKSGTDYTVSYKSNKSVGTATVTVTGKGNYSGTKKITFKINPKGTSVSSVTSPKKAQLKVTFKKQTTQTTGYQIQYSLKSDFSGAKSVTVSSNKTTSKTISSLKSGKKYYVRIRTYKTVNKTKYYSGWQKYSKAVKVK